MTLVERGSRNSERGLYINVKNQNGVCSALESGRFLNRTMLFGEIPYDRAETITEFVKKTKSAVFQGHTLTTIYGRGSIHGDFRFNLSPSGTEYILSLSTNNTEDFTHNTRSVFVRFNASEVEVLGSSDSITLI